jgi:hypothetical protein
MASSQEPILDYGSPPPIHQRRSMRRWAIIAAVILSGLWAWSYGPSAWRNLKIDYYLRQCSAYTAPANQIVYQENAAVTAARYPKGFVPVGQQQPVVSLSITPQPWTDYCSALGGSSLRGTVLFMHERTSLITGQKKLVVITFEEWTAFEWQFTDYTESANPYETQSGSPRYDFHNDDTFRVRPGTLTFYAGQPDPADSSHFTIGYTSEGKTGTIDGWLLSDGTIKIQVRDGPMKAP